MIMKLALIQMAACPEKEDSLRLAEDYLRGARREGADIAMLPEMFNCPYKTENFPLYAEEEGGISWQRMSQAAKKNHMYLVAGSMPERDSKGHIYNTSYVFDREGKQIAKHRKIHLFDIDVKGGQYFRESDTVTAGDRVTLFETEFGKFGLMICYDIRFPELTRLMAVNGATMVFVPAVFNMTTGPVHWEIIFRVRAIDNQLFMAGCSQARRREDYISYGNSIITSPWGDVVGRLNEKEGMLLREIDFSEVERTREELPFLKQRRMDVYSLQDVQENSK